MLKSIPRLTRNVQLAIHRAALNGRKTFQILFGDGACPAEGCNDVLDSEKTTFANLIPPALALAPLRVDLERAVGFHYPSDPDHEACPPDKIKWQWWDLIVRSVPGMVGREFTPLQREQVYELIETADGVIVARDERADYANLSLIVNPTESWLMKLPRELTPDLAIRMDGAGHQSRVVVTGRNSRFRDQIASHDRYVLVEGSGVLDVVRAIQTEWEPDTAEQAEIFPMRQGLGAFNDSHNAQEIVQPVLDEHWQKIGPLEELQISTLEAETRRKQVVAFVETEEKTDLVVVMVNGVTRDPLQGAYV